MVGCFGVLEQKRELIGLLLDLFRERFPHAVSGCGVDSDQNRTVSFLCGLKRSGKLEGVGRYDAVVVIGGRNQCGRIVATGTDVVQRRIGIQPCELFGKFAVAVFDAPSPTDGEVLVAQHIHNAYGGESDGEEVGTLGHTGSDEQASVRSARYGQFSGGGVSAVDQLLCNGDKVIENVLFPGFHSGPVPLLSELPSAPQIGDYV